MDKTPHFPIFLESIKDNDSNQNEVKENTGYL